MSYVLNLGDIVECTIVGTQYGETTLNVLHYKYTNITPTTNGPAALAALAAWQEGDPTAVGQQMTTQLSSNWTLASIRCQVIFPTRYAYVLHTVGTPGSLVQTALPANTQASITKRTTIAGRGKTGRMEVPGIPLLWIDGGALNATGLFNVGEIASKIPNVANLATGTQTWVPVIFQRASPSSSPQIISAQAQDTVRVARRRTVRVGI